MDTTYRTQRDCHSQDIRTYGRGSSEKKSVNGDTKQGTGDREQQRDDQRYVHTYMCNMQGTQSIITILYILYILYINVPVLTKTHFAFLTINWLLGALTTL